jgi:hypothetical protein
MPETPKIPQELLDRIAKVTNKRARLVLDKIVQNGSVSTEQIKQTGLYDHPPRAAQDVKDWGFRLKTTRVKNTNGHSIVAYSLDTAESSRNRTGRRNIPKKRRDALIHDAGNQCQICGAKNNLQVDHRIPYEVAGEACTNEERPFQVLCGSCNRKKSWDCEQCRNRREIHKPDLCRSCYWAEPTLYDHIAMQQQRRADLVWIGDEVKDFERIQRTAEHHSRSVSDEIKLSLKNH